MSWYDRDYYRQQPGPYQHGPLNFGLPKPTRIVKYLLILNFAVFVITAAGRGGVFNIYAYFQLQNGSIVTLQLWRLISYQFLHGNPSHIFWNMLGLYFFGPPIEQYWGARRFTVFYLSCGVVGGLMFLLLGSLQPMPHSLVGASGSVLGLLGACAVLFPRMMILLLFFPVPIRFAALLFGGMYALNVLWSRDLADACHLAGMLTGVACVWVMPLWYRFVTVSRRHLDEKQQADRQIQQEQVDAILAKVHREGIHRLTRKEKRILQQATDMQRREDERRRQRFR